MGRHRRSGAAAAADEYAAGGAAGSSGRRRGARRKKSAGLPTRGGLLGASAAMAVGAVAVTSGLLPGGEKFSLGSGSSGEQIRSGSSPELNAQGGATAAPTATHSSASPTPSPSPSLAAPSKTPSPTPTTASPSSPPRTKTASPTPTKTATTAPRTATTAPKTTAPTTLQKTTSREAAAEAAVLDLVNKERAKAGCSPLRASSDLADLARAFSRDMAARDFFSHTDPDGDGPWDRAAQAGVEGLGGENIARGQADAEAVMSSWMNSEGHRANILNCDFKTLGVGVHFGDGGPWWTQNFGF
ncbi:CAP domain-containing protein [Streptomyces sp. TRM49041]|uniref:CAP domain-containing protein n=1 Tax=Streptomyces sp. TRM49041 TaxID=2603216 RepID=UPI0011EDFF6E|nr:CAP domain-containing protein [Streptomyces sp. TRM49041]